MKISVIIPFVAEYPQILFTIKSVWDALKDSDFDFEVMAIDNWCEQAAAQVMWKWPDGKPFTRSDFWGHQFKKKDESGQSVPQPNRCGDRVASYAAMHPWLTYLHYDKKLSHWQAKNLGVANSTGEILFFLDGHCMVDRYTLLGAIRHYSTSMKEGTLHLPVTYFLERDKDALIYKLVADPERCLYHYSFTKYRKSDTPYTVPCMSTCGMLMSRLIYDDLGGWPELMGIYGGGEHFVNFTLATLGYTIHIFPGAAVHHYAEKRGYNYEYTDYQRNRILATYMFGGEDMADTFSKQCKLDENTRLKVLQQVLDEGATQRQSLASKQVIGIEEWVKKWRPDHAE